MYCSKKNTKGLWQELEGGEKGIVKKKETFFFFETCCVIILHLRLVKFDRKVKVP